MPLLGQFSIGLNDFFLSGVSFHSQNLVVVPLLALLYEFVDFFEALLCSLTLLQFMSALTIRLGFKRHKTKNDLQLFNLQNDLQNALVEALK